MPSQFAVLASGSRGNAALVAFDATLGMLIDVGLGPKRLTERLRSVGSGLDRISSALLTHTHGDHVDGFALGLLARKGVVLFCHEGHCRSLRRFDSYCQLERRGLVRFYDDRPFLALNGARVEPIELNHDGGPTFGFRIEARKGKRGRPAAVGYVADTGTWKQSTVDGLIDVDVLGVEFNHDVELQRRSGRPAVLIARNLSDQGHLSNDQGAELVKAVIRGSKRGRVREVVLLHLSAECNNPGLAITAAKEAVRSTGRRVQVHAALQDPAHPNLQLFQDKSRIAAAPIQVCA